MAHTRWTAVPLDSMGDAPHAEFIDALKPLVGTPDGARRSDSGQIALAVPLGKLQAADGFEVQLDSAERTSQLVVLVLADKASAALSGEVSELSASGGLVAIPAILSTEARAGLRARGRILQRVDATLPKTFEVWEERGKMTDLLTRDAPVKIEEGPDNLTEREAWFKKRHGRDP